MHYITKSILTDLPNQVIFKKFIITSFMICFNLEPLKRQELAKALTHQFLNDNWSKLWCSNHKCKDKEVIQVELHSIIVKTLVTNYDKELTENFIHRSLFQELKDKNLLNKSIVDLTTALHSEITKLPSDGNLKQSALANLKKTQLFIVHYYLISLILAKTRYYFDIYRFAISAIIFFLYIGHYLYFNESNTLIFWALCGANLADFAYVCLANYFINYNLRQKQITSAANCELFNVQFKVELKRDKPLHLKLDQQSDASTEGPNDNTMFFELTPDHPTNEVHRVKQKNRSIFRSDTCKQTKVKSLPMLSYIYNNQPFISVIEPNKMQSTVFVNFDKSKMRHLLSKYPKIYEAYKDFFSTPQKRIASNSHRENGFKFMPDDLLYGKLLSCGKFRITCRLIHTTKEGYKLFQTTGFSDKKKLIEENQKTPSSKVRLFKSRSDTANQHRKPLDQTFQKR